MRSLYITFIELKEGDGITKKIKAQCQALAQRGLDIELTHKAVRDGVIYYVIDSSEYRFGNRVVARLKSGLRYRLLYDYIKSEGIKFVYIRYTFEASANYINFLRRLKELGVVVYIEIPTYPYDGENIPKNLYSSYNIHRERHYRLELHRYVDRIVTFSSDKNIFNTDCINISNAIDFNAIDFRANRPNHDYVKFVAVATMSFWHGYDRMIKAVSEYYKTWDSLKPLVYLDIVGGGSIYGSLQDQIKELNVEQYVKMHGRKEGEELTEIFNDADICVGSLGRHRSGLTEMKALKNVEYAARGIPFIYSEINVDFEDKEYVYKISADEELIDIEMIIDSLPYKSLDPQAIRNSVSYLSWDAQMSVVVSNLKQIVRD